MSIRAARPLAPRRSAVAGARAALAVALAALAACAAQPPLPADPAGALFARGLSEITDLYIEPISSRRLALSGAARLAALDRRLAVFETPASGERVVFEVAYDGRRVAAYPIPASGGAEDWGRLLGETIAAAKRVSPRIAAMPQAAIEQAVFDGITGALDRFSRYAAPDVARDRRAARDGFGGIGVTVDLGDRYRVTAVAPNGPAERGGIRAEERIVAIDGAPIAGLSQGEIVHRLRGPVASTVAVAVARPGLAQTRDFRLQRALVIVPTVTVSRDGDIALFRVAAFNKSTTRRLAAGLRDAEREAGGRLAGIVLDLRSNPGGLLDQAVSLTDLFVADGPIVSTIGRHPASRQYFAASGDSIAPRLPVVVLINGGSASAAEIVAAALQDRGRAVVVGSSSYGKGTVQTVLRLPNKGELTFTWARLLTPSGYRLDAHGVVPTLCTSGLGDDSVALEAAVARAGAAAPPSSASARAALDEPAWSRLRRSCPARHSSPAIDIKLAERLLADPRLYSAALHAIPPPVGLARIRPKAPRAPSLTGPGSALSFDGRPP